MVAICQVAECVQLRNHFCYTFEHEVSMETVKRVTEVKFDNNVVATHAFNEASNSMHRHLASTGNSDADLGPKGLRLHVCMHIWRDVSTRSQQR